MSSWHDKLDRLRTEFLEETDAILGGTDDKELRLRLAAEIDMKASRLCADVNERFAACYDEAGK